MSLQIVKTLLSFGAAKTDKIEILMFLKYLHMTKENTKDKYYEAWEKLKQALEADSFYLEEYH